MSQTSIQYINSPDYNSNQQTKQKINIINTNNVLIHKQLSSNTIFEYLPGYFRVKLKNFIQINLTNLTSEVNTDLIFNIFYGKFFEQRSQFQKMSPNLNKYGQEQTYKEQALTLLQSQMKLNFSRGEAILLSETTNGEENLQILVKNQKQNNQIRFTVRKSFNLHLQGKLWLSPFQIINSILEVTVQTITLKVQKIKYVFRVNLMNSKQQNLKLSVATKKMILGRYGLATNYAKSDYTNIKIQKSFQIGMDEKIRYNYLKKKHGDQDQKAAINNNILYFQYATFNFPLYKFPLDTIVTVCIPLWLLGIINLGIFFQDGTLSDRIASIIALTIAFIAYIPTIEQTIPPSANIVLTQWLVFVQILATFATFIHSMRVRFEGSLFRLDWSSTPQYWIALLMTVISCGFVIILTLTHYLYWEKKYLNRQKNKNQKIIRNAISQDCVYEKDTSKYSSDQICRIKSNKIKFDGKTWRNSVCDHYFTRYFQLSQNKQLKRQNALYSLSKQNNQRSIQLQNISKDKNDKKQQTRRQFQIQTLQKGIKSQNFLPSIQDEDTAYILPTEQQSSNIKSQKKSNNKDANKQSTVNNSQASKNSKSRKNQPKKYKQYKSANPLVQVKYQNEKQQKQNKQKNKKTQIKTIDVYLPGYLRLKFKKIVGLDLQDLSGQLNATMIFSIYYGGLFNYLIKQYKMNPKQQERLLNKMSNQFVILFAKGDAIQLTEGKQSNKKMQSNKNNKQGNPQQNLKIKRNIQTTVNVDKQKRTIQFTIRKTFGVRLYSHVFLTPFERIKTIIDITVNSLKDKVKLQDSKCVINININLMDNEKAKQKISISELKKFGQYGLILPQIDANYFNDKIIAEQQFKLQTLKLKSLTKQKISRIYKDLKKVFVQQQYVPLRQAYRDQYGSKDQFKKFCLQQDQKEKQYKKQHKSTIRQFQSKKKFQAYKYASFKIPMYKFPFTSIASIFLPLWLLALLNLGIFFQQSSLANRIMSIASLMIAFVALIPVIRIRIPPSSKITLVEYIVAALIFATFLALGHSMSVRHVSGYEFNQWSKDAWFVISLIISILSILIIVVLLIIHYVIWQPKYKHRQDNGQKQKLYRNRWYHEQCEKAMQTNFIFQHVYNTDDGEHEVYGLKNKLDNKNRVNKNEQRKEKYGQRSWISNQFEGKQIKKGIEAESETGKIFNYDDQM